VWLYAAMDPTTGTGVFLLLPTVEGACLELFLQHLRHELGDGPIGVVLDSSGSHRSGQVVWPQDMHPLYLPPYSPEREFRRADLPAYPQAPLQYRFRDPRRVAKRAH
jgi:transposase